MPITLGAEMHFHIDWWWQANKSRGGNSRLRQLIPFLFFTLDGLYLETRKLPFKATGGAMAGRVDKSDHFGFGIWLNEHDYAALRSILAFAGDLRLILESLKRTKGQLELAKFMTPLYKESMKYKDARDFFTHIDEVLRDFGNHGAAGPYRTSFGLDFADGVKNNVYLYWDDNKLFFTFDHKHKEVLIDKSSFDPVFKLARELYSEVINNPQSIADTSKTSPENVYPI